jgi:hypothetical protein
LIPKGEVVFFQKRTKPDQTHERDQKERKKERKESRLMVTSHGQLSMYLSIL